MGSILNPYLIFGGDAKHAMERYREVFGGQLNIMKFAEGGMPHEPADAEKVMHAQLEAPNGFVLMASDTPDGSAPAAGNISVSLSGDDVDALRGYWDQLSDGGTVEMALKQAPWGDSFGQCVDRFGVRWLVNISSEAE